MSGRLDQSLDSIIDGQKKIKRDARRRVRKPTKAGEKVAAPVGGIKKSVKPARPVVKAAATTAQKPARISKIVVSGLPMDVNEAQIKEYFQKSVGAVRNVSLHYNRNGQSRGIADISFSKPDSAAKAAKDLNGMLVDGKPMKIEVVVDASNVPAPEPAKSLSERVAYANPQKTQKSAPLTKSSANPKAQPKSATAVKTADAKKGKAGKQAKPRRVRSSRPKPKTTEELDAEMVDYFGGNNAANGTTIAEVVAAASGNTGAAAATGDDMGMEEISVRQPNPHT